MIKQVLLFFSLLFIISNQINAQCYTTFFEEGQRLAKANKYEIAISQFRAAARCPKLNDTQRISIEQAIEAAQQGYITSINSARKKAEAAQALAERQADLAERRAEQVRRQLALTEANRLSFLADQELANGNHTDGFALAFLAFQQIDTMLVPKVKLSFGDAINQNFRQEFDAGQQGLIGFTFSPDGKYLLTSTQDSSVFLWHFQTPLDANKKYIVSKKELTQLQKSASYTMSFTGLENYPVVGTREGIIQLFDTSTFLIKTLEGHQAEISGLATSPDRQQLISWSRNGLVYLWDLATQKGVQLDLHEAPIRNADFSADSELLFTWGADRTIGLWNRQGQLIQQVQHDAIIYSATFSPDGTEMLSCAADGKAILWNAKSQRKTELSHNVKLVTTAGFLPFSSNMFTTTADGQVHLWESSGKKIRNIAAHKQIITRAGVSPTQDFWYTVGKDQSISLWTEQGKALLKLDQHNNTIKQAEVSPNGNYLLSLTLGGILKVWDRQGDVVLQLYDEEAQFWKAAFSPNGQIIAGLRKDGKLVLIPLPHIIYTELKNGRQSAPVLSTEKQLRYGLSAKN